MNQPDRLKLLLAADQVDVTGIDYVKVGPDQTALTVFFLKEPDTISSSLVNDLEADKISIREIPAPTAELSETGDEAQLPIEGISWLTIGDKQALQLQLSRPGGFMPYRLTIADTRLDPYYNSVVFSFKADCPTDLDCQPDDPSCVSEDRVDFAVDYGARDYDSFRRALLDFAAQRYPRWQDRIAADVGVMLTEVLSALGDELAYYQDQIRRQAYLETASERRSLRRHARLVDTEISDGDGAATWLDFTVEEEENGPGSIPAGADVWAASDGGRTIHYEVGSGLAETMDGRSYAVSAQLNSLEAHIWDEDDACLLRGATRLDIRGAYRALLISMLYSIDGQDQPGRWLVLKTNPSDPSKTPRRHLVWINATGISEITDPLIKDGDQQSETPDPQPVTVTRIQWQANEALPFDMDLEELEIRGNIVPATAGKTYPDSSEVPQARFVVGRDPDDPDLGLPADQLATLERAVEREGAAGYPTYLYSLPLSETTPVTWLKGADEIAVPEVILKEVVWNGSSWQHVQHKYDWTVVRSFTGPPGSSLPEDRHVILDDGTWRRVVGYRRNGNTIIHRDYAANEGKTVRFGSGDLGRVPTAGSVFEVTYRLGNGLATQVAADTLTKFDPAALDVVQSVTNPFAAENARDPDTPMQTRLTAPEAYQQLTYRAVRPEDYAEAAERLDWVQKAACPFRWTGSWSTGMATADPYDTVTLSDERHRHLIDHLERFRLAGHDVAVVAPRYADLDLEIRICVDPSAYRGEVKAMVLNRLLDAGGFFDPDHFSFGDPLYRAQLEAAVQSISGVRAVDAIRIKRQGYFNWRPFDEAYYEIAVDEIVRIANDPRYPTRGSVKLIAEGGA
ncbi:MAG: hypothetical protein QNI97_08225 [Desulfobacterales bacterium]|nr:hypothetical protein [Desulfobacterales bacterium]